jgi:hypothetical protein
MTQTTRGSNVLNIGICCGSAVQTEEETIICPKCNNELKPTGWMEYYE